MKFVASKNVYSREYYVIHKQDVHEQKILQGNMQKFKFSSLGRKNWASYNN